MIQEFLFTFWLGCFAAQPKTENIRNSSYSEFANLPKQVDA